MDQFLEKFGLVSAYVNFHFACNTMLNLLDPASLIMLAPEQYSIMNLFIRYNYAPTTSTHMTGLLCPNKA